MSRVALIICLGLAATACKGKTEFKVDPKTQDELDACKKDVTDKKTYIATLEKQVADLSLGGDKVLVNIEGEPYKITGKGPHEGAGEPHGNADDAKLYDAFVTALKKSRGSIQKCYQNALKKDTSLQARTITLNIEVIYKTSGIVSSASFNPRVSETFNQCMDAVARHWTLPGMPRVVSFAYKQTLTPE